MTLKGTRSTVQKPASAGSACGASRRFALGLVRAFGGAILFNMRAKGSRISVGVATFLLTTVGWLLLLNLTLGNKQIDERIETEYSVTDPQFRVLPVSVRDI